MDQHYVIEFVGHTAGQHFPAVQFCDKDQLEAKIAAAYRVFSATSFVVSLFAFWSKDRMQHGAKIINN